MTTQDELNRIVLKKEPVEVKFQDCVNADEISGKEAYELHELIEEENERILRHGDRGGFEEG